MIVNNQKDLNSLIRGGQITKLVLKKALDAIKVGVSTMDINTVVENEIKKHGASASFYGVDAGEGPYPYSCCVSINHQVVHTLPSSKSIIKTGDIVTVDLGVKYKGFHTDTAYTVQVNSNSEEYFLNTGKKALKAALRQAIAGNYTGDLSHQMQKHAESAGFTVSVDLVGHGIGRKLHEPPQILCYGKKGSGEKLKAGQALAVEIMYMKGKSDLVLGEDGFSIDTKDKGLAAQFEHTIVVQENSNPLIIV